MKLTTKICCIQWFSVSGWLHLWKQIDLILNALQLKNHPLMRRQSQTLWGILWPAELLCFNTQQMNHVRTASMYTNSRIPMLTTQQYLMVMEDGRCPIMPCAKCMYTLMMPWKVQNPKMMSRKHSLRLTIKLSQIGLP